MAERILWAIFHPKALLDGYNQRGKDMCELMGQNDRLIRTNTKIKESNRALRKADRSKRSLRNEIEMLKAERIAKENDGD